MMIFNEYGKFFISSSHMPAAIQFLFLRFLRQGNAFVKQWMAENCAVSFLKDDLRLGNALSDFTKHIAEHIPPNGVMCLEGIKVC